MLRRGIQQCSRILEKQIAVSRTASNVRILNPSPFPLWNRPYSQAVPLPVKITYVEADGNEIVVDAQVGQNLLEVAHENNVELEGACGGELACSTCHLIFEKDVYATLPPMQEEEEDMLDLAFEVTETSRLGCQILVREDMEGMTVQIPDDGF